MGIALVILAGIVVWKFSVPKVRGDGNGPPTNGPNEPKPPTPPPPVNNPNEVKEVAEQGKTYSIVANGTASARVTDKAWGTKTITNMAFAYETLIDRQIERNDGSTIVEVREFKSVKGIKGLCDSEFKFDFGLPGTIVFGALHLLDYFEPGLGTGAQISIASVKPFAEAIGSAGASMAADIETAKIVAQVNEFHGVRVRITYVDGKGVTIVEHLGKPLSQEQRDLIMNTAVLSDYYILPNVQVAEGKRWSVSASNLMTMFDPSLDAYPSGELTFERAGNHEYGGHPVAVLKIVEGTVGFDASDDRNRRVAQFWPSGTLNYNIKGRFVESAELSGKIDFEEVSKDHLLFETQFKTEPKIKITYSCKKH
jgi:hypothetical protein